MAVEMQRDSVLTVDAPPDCSHDPVLIMPMLVCGCVGMLITRGPLSSSPTGYVLRWEVSGVESSAEEKSLSNTTLQYQLSGLTSTTAYTLQVAALTAAGRGVVTASTISTGVPPGK